MTPQWTRSRHSTWLLALAVVLLAVGLAGHLRLDRRLDDAATTSPPGGITPASQVVLDPVGWATRPPVCVRDAVTPAVGRTGLQGSQR